MESVLEVVAVVSGLCMVALFVRERRAGARWRWPAVALAAWVALGLFGPVLGRARFWVTDSLPWTFVAALASLVAIVRAPPRRMSTRLPMAMLTITLLATLSFAGWGCLLGARDTLYPWTDNAAPHAVIHVENGTRAPLTVHWKCTQRFGSGTGTIAAESDSFFYAIVYDEQQLALDGLLTIDGAGDTPLRTPLALKEHDHVRVRVHDDGRATVTSGSESRAGWPVFDGPVVSVR